ncbi:MAG: 4Fe-4S binding protein [Desulfobacterales bacterium]|nr:4Fe-4S binding protein [Desulfobacterales bacterium]
MVEELYHELTKAIGAGDSKIIPKIFEGLCTPVEARFLLSASPPRTAEELAAGTGLSIEKVEDMISSLFQRGLLFKSRKPDGIRYYRVRHIMQFHDATILSDDISKDILDLWKEHTKKELPEFFWTMKNATGRAPGRVIPIHHTIRPQNQVLDKEDVRAYIQKAKSLAVTRCTCRVSSGNCDKPLEVCLQLDKSADYSIERGSGRSVTKDEALDIMKKAENEGLIHKAENRAGRITMLCNCCTCCCVDWSSEEVMSIPVAGPSRFCAEIDEGICSECGICVETCAFDALCINDDGSSIPFVDKEKCLGCGVCAVRCPDEAISLNEVREPDYIPAD